MGHWCFLLVSEQGQVTGIQRPVNTWRVVRLSSTSSTIRTLLPLRRSPTPETASNHWSFVGLSLRVFVSSS